MSFSHFFKLLLLLLWSLHLPSHTHTHARSTQSHSKIYWALLCSLVDYPHTASDFLWSVFGCSSVSYTLFFLSRWRVWFYLKWLRGKFVWLQQHTVYLSFLKTGFWLTLAINPMWYTINIIILNVFKCNLYEYFLFFWKKYLFSCTNNICLLL